MKILGIDVGGSGIKAAVINTQNGEMVSERLRIPTPKPATPMAIAEVIKTLTLNFEWDGPVGISFPTVIKNGKALQYGNLDPSCQGTQLEELFSNTLGNPCFVVNDADAAALGVMEFGIGKDQKGLVITITIGTGIGSGVFFDGKLLANFELGRLYGKKGDILESFASDATRKRKEWSLKSWSKRLNFVLNHIEQSFNPDLIILGGGISKKFNEFKDFLSINTPLKAAELKNNAGIIGAAIYAKAQLKA